MVRRVLIIAFHFPPVLGSSGVHRLTSFAQGLSTKGWDVTVLTAHERAYAQLDLASIDALPPAITVIRAQSLDAARHLSVNGAYFDFLAIPDRWQSWILPAVSRAVIEHRKSPFDVIFATYPIPSALVIARLVAKLTGVPWIADLRDPITQEGFPKDPNVRRRLQNLERRVVGSASRVCLTTNASRDYYAAKYAKVPSAFWQMIENGFDEVRLGPLLEAPANDSSRERLRILHSGLVYAKDRNPEMLFLALGKLRRSGLVAPGSLSVVFRGSGQDKMIRQLAAQHGVDDFVSVEPAIPYADAVKEMCAADALLVLQGAGVDRQIPAKVYEYLYVGRPVIGLTTPDGSTGRLLLESGVQTVAPLESAQAIEQLLSHALPDIRAGRYRMPSRESVMRYSRQTAVNSLADLLQAVSSEGVKLGP